MEVKEKRLGRPLTDDDKLRKSTDGISVETVPTVQEQAEEVEIRKEQDQAASTQVMQGLTAMLQQKEILKHRISITEDRLEKDKLCEAFAEVEQSIENHHNEILMLSPPSSMPEGPTPSSIACSSGGRDPDQSMSAAPCSPRGRSVSATPDASPDRKKSRTEDPFPDEEDHMGHGTSFDASYDDP